VLDSRLQYVVAVARAGSFTAAAQALGITQPAITKSIADLEREIGYGIFYRTARGVIMTEDGRNFVDRVARLLEDAREILSGSMQRKDPFAGVLRIGVGPASLEWRLLDPLTELLRRHPGIRYDITSATFETVVQLLRTGGVDVALGFDAAFGEWSDLHREPMGGLEVELFVRKGHPLLHKATVRVADLADYDFVAPSDSRPYGDSIRDIYLSRNVRWEDRIHRVDYFPLVRRLVATSDAIGIATRIHSQTANFRARFEPLSGVDLWPPSPLCCARRARWEPKPAVRAFIAAIRQVLPPES